jgi:hypothetical protein
LVKAVASINSTIQLYGFAVQIARAKREWIQKRNCVNCGVRHGILGFYLTKEKRRWDRSKPKSWNIGIME